MRRDDTDSRGGCTMTFYQWLHLCLVLDAQQMGTPPGTLLPAVFQAAEGRLKP